MSTQWWPFRMFQSQFGGRKHTARKLKISRRPFFDTLEDRAVPAGLPEMSIVNAQTLEGDTGKRDLVFDVSLSAPSADTVTVFYGTADDTAINGQDYDAAGDLLNFAPGETQKQIVIKITGDTDVEPDETFKLTLQNPINATLKGAGEAIGTIQNDDTPPPPPPPAPPPPIPQGAPPAPAAARTNISFTSAKEIAPPDARLENTPVDQWLKISSETSKTDPSFYKITMATPFALAIDLHSAKGAPPINTVVFDGNQKQVYTSIEFPVGGGFPKSFAQPFSYDNAEGLPTDSGTYLDLPAGTYFIKFEVPFLSKEFTANILTDTVYSTTVPEFSSDPSAPVSLYIDFDGHASNSPTDYWVQTKGPYSFPALNFRGSGFDGNAGTFSPGERLFMRNTFNAVAEDYSIFNINVTTKNVPLVVNNVGVGQRMIVTNKDADTNWSPGAAGYAPLNGFSQFPGEGPGIGYVKTDLTNQTSALRDNASALVGAGSLVSHEMGHAFGLQHQWTTKTTIPDINGGPSLGFGIPGLISGGQKFRVDENLATWMVGLNTPGQLPPPNPQIVPFVQTDIDIIADPKNKAGYRADDAGNTTAAAFDLKATNDTYTKDGIIGLPSDVDFYKFTASGKTTIEVTVGNHASDPNLVTMIELYDKDGQLVTKGDKVDGDRSYTNFHATLTTRTSKREGVYTMPAGHGLAVGNKVDIAWGENGAIQRIRSATVTAVNNNLVTITGGEDDTLPRQGVSLIVARPLPSGASTITRDLTSGTYFLKVSGLGRRATDTATTFIESLGQYRVNIRTAQAPQNKAPVVTLPGGNITVKGKDPAKIIDIGATVKDADSADFKGGKMTISLANSTLFDALQFESDNVLETTGNTISVNKVDVATFDGGNGGTPLVITFTSDKATPDVAQIILRHVTFLNTAQARADLGTTRVLSVVVSDRQGAVSTPISKAIDVVAPDLGAIKLVNNLGLTVTTDAPKVFTNADLLITAPDGPLGPQTVFYTVTQVPKNGSLVYAKQSDDPTSPNFLPVILKVGDEFTQKDIENGYLAYRLTPGSTATDDKWSFTATDTTTGVIPETVVKIRVGQGAAPLAPAAPIGIQEWRDDQVTAFDVEAPNITITIDDSTIENVISNNFLRYLADDPHDLVYEVISGPTYGTLNLSTFSQQTIDDNGLVYTTPLVSNVPAGVTQDSFTYVVRDLETGGITDAVTFIIGFDNPNDAPYFINDVSSVDIGSIYAIGDHSLTASVQDILTGVFNDPDYVPGEPSGFGLAITGADTAHGLWQYSTDGGDTWTDLPADLSTTNALLLSGYHNDTLVRFAADSDYDGIATLQFYLWDETEGESGSFFDITSTHTNAFSLTSADAVITIQAEAQTPSFTGGPDQTINQNAGLVVVAAWATDIQGDNLATPQFVVASDDDGQNDLVFTTLPSISPDGTLTYEVAPGSTGSSTFQVYLTSPVGDSSVAELTITVNAVNQAPTITPGPSVRVGAGAGNVTLLGWATNIGPGADNEAEQTLTLRIYTDNPSLFDIQPALDLETGDLTFAPNSGAFGIANVFVSIDDDGGTANGGAQETTRGFTITIDPVLKVSAQTQNWIRQLYQDNLHRDAEPGALNDISTRMAAGATRDDIANMVVSSYEYATWQVHDLFVKYLHRTPDETSMGFAVNLQNGTPYKTVQAQILASPEYLALNGSSNTGFTAGVFHDVLGRTIENSAAVYYGDQLAADSDRYAVANQVLDSQEAANVFVDTSCRTLLGRSATGDDLDKYVPMLLDGTPENDIIQMILTSDEYFDNAHA